jgi:ABC-type polysaccharide/polyol phosphate transport system ATPase subunit/SAM-dependent methyltransferase
MQPDADVAIRAISLSKTFRIPHETRSTLREYVIHPFRHTTYEVQQALAEVSFTIKAGEFFGVIGRNGSGKSTLLKILAGIYRADRGSVEVTGKLSPFIELGVGFNPDLNARDNIRINGTLLGLSQRELAQRFDEIVTFAELERFIDQSLKNYSSGMQLRLAYAIAIQVPFDILLLDEVLAVGDQNFQEKCFDTFERMRDEGKTVVLVTHGLDSVARFCDRALLLRDGTVQKIGPPDEVIDLYLTQEQARRRSVGRRTDRPVQPEEGETSEEGASEDGQGRDGHDNGQFDQSTRRQDLRDLELVVREWREKTGRQALGVLEDVIRDQRVRLEERDTGQVGLPDLENELRDARRDIVQLTMMTEILMHRHCEEVPFPPEPLRLRTGKRSSELNFLAQGLTSADLVLNALGDSPDSPVLEWGCGTGRTLRWLASYPGWSTNYYGCDTDEEAVTWLSQGGRFRVLVIGAEPPLPYADQMFGSVFSLSMLTRIEPESHRKWLADLHRIVAGRGLVYVTTHGPSAARARGTVASEFEEKGSAYVSNDPHRSAAFVSEEFMRRAADQLFSVDLYEERGHKTMDAYVLRRLENGSTEKQR